MPKTDQPDIATLEREGVRLHHCLATEGLSDRGEDAKPDKADTPKKPSGKSG
jgi:hypothetical protein